MGQSAQYGHLFFVHKIHRKIYPVEGSRENASSPTVDIGNMWKLSDDISRDRCPQRSVREAAKLMVLCTGAGAPKASPGGKLSSAARLMRAAGGDLTGRTSIRPTACRDCTPALIRLQNCPGVANFESTFPPGEGRRLWRKKTARNFPGGDFQLMRTFMNRLSTKRVTSGSR